VHSRIPKSRNFRLKEFERISALADSRIQEFLTNRERERERAAARIPDEHRQKDTEREREGKKEERRRRRDDNKAYKNSEKGEKKTSNFRAKLNSFQKSLHIRALKL
jgi:hypothetical protein